MHLAGPSLRPNTAELTPRESQVLTLVAEGLSNKKIGDAALYQRQNRQRPCVGHHAQARRIKPYRGRQACQDQEPTLMFLPGPCCGLSNEGPHLAVRALVEPAWRALVQVVAQNL